MDIAANLKSIFPGNSEMAQRRRAFDWSGSDLGLPGDWPDALKTSVRIILTSRHPMFVWWGDNLINLYNDGYAGFLLSKHPSALGKPASAVWPEIWQDVIVPRLSLRNIRTVAPMTKEWPSSCSAEGIRRRPMPRFPCHFESGV
jgi:hypothetical protein